MLKFYLVIIHIRICHARMTSPFSFTYNITHTTTKIFFWHQNLMTSQFYTRTLQCCVTENIIHRKLDGRGTHTKIRIRACRWNEYIPWHGSDNQSSDSKLMVEHDFSRGPWWPEDTVDAVWCVEVLENVGRNFMVSDIYERL